MSTLLTSIFRVKMLRRCGVSSPILNEDSDSENRPNERFISLSWWVSEVVGD